MAINTNGPMLNEETSASASEKSRQVAPLFREGSVLYGYQEVPQNHPNRMDVIEQLRANIRQIEDLNGRLAFLLKEVQSVIKKA